MIGAPPGGLGETYPRNATEAALVHADVARRLLGRDPRDIEAIGSELFRAFDYQVSGGAEMRVLSAVDLALWDLLGQALGVPVYRLIGGRSNPRVPVYNTCFLLSERMAGPFALAAEAHQLLVVPHTAGGPLLFYASTHLTTAVTNVAVQESCQRYFERDWPAMLEDPIVPVDGTVAAPDLPGFGIRVKPEVWSHPKAVVRTSTV